MKHLVIYDNSGNASIISPAPANAESIGGNTLVVTSVPELPEGRKYIVTNGVLSTTPLSGPELAARSAFILNRSLKVARSTSNTTIANGFTYSTATFSLEPMYRDLYLQIYVESKHTQLGNTNIPTLTDTQFVVNAGNIEAFYSAYKTAFLAILEAERVAKAAIRNA